MWSENKYITKCRVEICIGGDTPPKYFLTCYHKIVCLTYIQNTELYKSNRTACKNDRKLRVESWSDIKEMGA